ncbi:hypothetical protein OROMI_023107 [Orobanche minor]
MPPAPSRRDTHPVSSGGPAILRLIEARNISSELKPENICTECIASRSSREEIDWNEMLIERYIGRETRPGIISENTSYDFDGDLMGITDTVLQQVNVVLFTTISSQQTFFRITTLSQLLSHQRPAMAMTALDG